MNIVTDIAKGAKRASRVLAQSGTAKKNEVLDSLAAKLLLKQEEIISANKLDMDRGKEKGLSKALLDRLELTPARVSAMAKGLRELISLPDPVGDITGMTTRPNGLVVGRMKVPLGVIGIVYESRPNVTIDASGLCLKSGNAVILRGGSEAFESNALLGRIAAETLTEAGLPPECISIIPTADRSAVTSLVQQKGLVDLVIARGGGSMIHALSEVALVPMIEHGGGVCHVYIHEAADLKKAVDIAVNAKVNRPGVCNAAETILVDRSIANEVLPRLIKELRDQSVEVRGCPETSAVVPDVLLATEDDWRTEYLDLIISIRVVSGFEEAVQHINEYSTHHSDAIITENYGAAKRFTAEIDSAAVYVNASTRFTDGNEFGLGAEIGISTQKLHARGPMGLNELTCSKYVIFGTGQVRR